MKIANGVYQIVNIEAETFERMLSRVELFADRMGLLCELYGDGDIKQWLDNQDVCQLLNISKRTLQTLRDNGRLVYSRIGHKIYYKPDDVQKILPLMEEKHKQAKYRGNYCKKVNGVKYESKNYE